MMFQGYIEDLILNIDFILKLILNQKLVKTFYKVFIICLCYFFPLLFSLNAPLHLYSYIFCHRALWST